MFTSISGGEHVCLVQQSLLQPALSLHFKM